MKKLTFLPLLAVLVLAGCASLVLSERKITPEVQAEIEAQTENTVTIYFGMMNLPDKKNHGSSFSLSTDPEVISEIHNNTYKYKSMDYVKYADIQNALNDTQTQKEGTSILVYKAEIEPQIGILTVEFAINSTSSTVPKGMFDFGPSVYYEAYDTLLINKTPGTYYYAASCYLNESNEAVLNFDEISAEIWAELVEPRIVKYGMVRDTSDPNFIRLPEDKM